MTPGSSSFDQCNTPACPGVIKPYFCICALVIQTLSEHETTSKEFGCGKGKYLQVKL
uniref:Expressed protein n=1 Tax=Echinococcus granulosus TaxID=6210 RepID=A0A068WUS5_ECHGR|nr:expressed protein [Echinococcus granulosus]